MDFHMVLNIWYIDRSGNKSYEQIMQDISCPFNEYSKCFNYALCKMITDFIDSFSVLYITDIQIFSFDKICTE